MSSLMLTEKLSLGCQQFFSNRTEAIWTTWNQLNIQWHKNFSIEISTDLTLPTFSLVSNLIRAEFINFWAWYHLTGFGELQKEKTAHESILRAISASGSLTSTLFDIFQGHENEPQIKLPRRFLRPEKTHFILSDSHLYSVGALCDWPGIKQFYEYFYGTTFSKPKFL